MRRPGAGPIRAGSRVVAAAVLLGCGWWVSSTLADIWTVAPVHWPMLLPYMALSGIPTVLGAVTASAMLFGRPGARALTLAFALTVAQAATVAYLAPDIPQRYEQVVEQGKQLVRDSLRP